MHAEIWIKMCELLAEEAGIMKSCYSVKADIHAEHCAVTVVRASAFITPLLDRRGGTRFLRDGVVEQLRSHFDKNRIKGNLSDLPPRQPKRLPPLLSRRGAFLVV